MSAENIQEKKLNYSLFSPESYLDLISVFVNSGYTIKKFSPVLYNQDSATIIIRHDVDISPELALCLARMETINGINSSFSFMLRSPFYNVLNSESVIVLTEIYNLGHDIFLHVDPFLYPDFYIGLKREMKIFRKFFPFINADIYSLHRPKSLATTEGGYNSINHIPQNVSSKILFGRIIDYISDSMAEWSNGYPIERESFKQRKSIQLVTHPFWWMQEGSTPVQKLKTYLGNFSSFQIEKIRTFLPKFYKQNSEEIALCKS
jgi:hypothetical protein